jgi:sarcosine oxidase subunit delta
MLEMQCPFCGKRPESEFWCIGEGAATIPDREMPADDLQHYLYFRPNESGIVSERWVHRFGCGEWLRVRRDTRDNRVVAVDFLREAVR